MGVKRGDCTSTVRTGATPARHPRVAGVQIPAFVERSSDPVRMFYETVRARPALRTVKRTHRRSSRTCELGPPSCSTRERRRWCARDGARAEELRTVLNGRIGRESTERVVRRVESPAESAPPGHIGLGALSAFTVRYGLHIRRVPIGPSALAGSAASLPQRPLQLLPAERQLPEGNLTHRDNVSFHGKLKNPSQVGVARCGVDPPTNPTR